MVHSKKFLSLVAAATLMFSVQAFAGDDDGAGVASPSNVVINHSSTLINPVNQSAATISDKFARTRFSEAAVNSQLNLTQEYFNATLQNVNDLGFKQRNASSWALDAKGLSEIVSVAGSINAEMKAIINMANEKDPTVAAQLEKMLNAKGLTSLASDVSRLYSMHGINPKTQTVIDLKDVDSGFVPAVIDGKTFNCTTEGYMTKTIADESWTLCVSANAGKVNNGADELINVAYGSFLPGDSTVTVELFPYGLTDPKYVLDLYNISATNPKTVKYYNGIMFGGDHLNSKPFGNTATATDTPVLKTNLPPVKKAASKPVVLDVRVVNPDSEPVPAKVVD